MIPGAPPPGTLHKRLRPASAYARQVQRARQPTGGWNAGDFCLTPTGRLCRVLAVGDVLQLQYALDNNSFDGEAADLSLRPWLCSWLSPRQVTAIRRPHFLPPGEGADAAA